MLRSESRIYGLDIQFSILLSQQDSEMELAFMLEPGFTCFLLNQGNLHLVCASCF